MRHWARSAAFALALGTAGGCSSKDSHPPGEETAGTAMRGRIIDVDMPGGNGRYRFDYYDVHEPDSDYAYLDSLGYQGGGPSWHGIVFGLLTLRSPATLHRIKFDPEGDGLAVWSDDRAALETIARLVAEAKASRALLHQAIDTAKARGRME